MEDYKVELNLYHDCLYEIKRRIEVIADHINKKITAHINIYALFHLFLIKNAGILQTSYKNLYLISFFAALFVMPACRL